MFCESLFVRFSISLFAKACFFLFARIVTQNKSVKATYVLNQAYLVFLSKLFQLWWQKRIERTILQTPFIDRRGFLTDLLGIVQYILPRLYVKLLNLHCKRSQSMFQTLPRSLDTVDHDSWIYVLVRLGYGDLLLSLIKSLYDSLIYLELFNATSRVALCLFVIIRHLYKYCLFSYFSSSCTYYSANYVTYFAPFQNSRTVLYFKTFQRNVLIDVILSG